MQLNYIKMIVICVIAKRIFYFFFMSRDIKNLNVFCRLLIHMKILAH